jgi:hypothetical protein
MKYLFLSIVFIFTSCSSISNGKGKDGTPGKPGTNASESQNGKKGENGKKGADNSTTIGL